jgi:putative redox protein
MSAKTVTASLEGDGLRLLATSGSGHQIVMDTAAGNGGATPAEILVAGQAGCTAMDVVSILRKKRQPFTRYEVRVVGEQRDEHYGEVVVTGPYESPDGIAALSVARDR